MTRLSRFTLPIGFTLLVTALGCNDGGGNPAGGGGGNGGTQVCQSNATCTTLGQSCQTSCTTGANSHSTYCTCADQGGGQPTLACVSLTCSSDAGGTTNFPTCTAGLQDGDNCTL